MKNIVLFFWLFLLAGCGLKSIVVPNLPWLITNKLNDSLSLERSQKKMLKADIKIILNDIKPNISDFLSKIEGLHLKEIDAQDLYEIILIDYLKLHKKVVPLYSKYLIVLNAGQWRHFQVENNQQNLKIEKNFKDVIKKIISRFESFLGELTNQQIEVLKNNKAHYLQQMKDRLARRKKFQEKLYSLAKVADVSQKNEKINLLFYQYSNNFRWNSGRQKSLEIINQIIVFSTPEQQRYFRKKIQKYQAWARAYLKHRY